MLSVQVTCASKYGLVIGLITMDARGGAVFISRLLPRPACSARDVSVQIHGARVDERETERIALIATDACGEAILEDRSHGERGAAAI
jgi:hypothetical protein